jgi:signal peptidase
VTEKLIERPAKALRPSEASRFRSGALDRLRHPDDPFTQRQAALWAAGVAAYLLAGWLLVQRGLAGWLSGAPSVNFYLVQPALWLGLAAVAYAGWRRLSERPPFSRLLIRTAALVGAFHVGVLVFGGILFGFGDSYVAGQFTNYPRNLWFVATWLLGLEVARAFIFHAWRPYRERAAFWATTVILALAMTPYGQLSSLARSETMANSLAGFIIPTFVLSILLTWLAQHGGLGPSMGYWSLLLSFEWFSQVQPDLDWPLLLVVGTIVPVISAKLIRNIYLNTPEGAARWWDEEDYPEPEEGRSSLLSFIVAALVLGVLAVGALLGYRPVVVNGISMEPAYERGDLAIIQRNVDPATLAVGDVVQFDDPSGRPVVHRIIAIENQATGPIFTTQGDNNPRPDGALSAEAINGKVVFLVPILGWPAIWLRGA